MQGMWVQSLGQEDPLEKERQPIPVFLPGKSHGQRSLVGYISQYYKRVGHNLAAKHNATTTLVYHFAPPARSSVFIILPSLHFSALSVLIPQS